MKLLYFDTETTGLLPDEHSIIEIAGLVEIDGRVVEEFIFPVKPFRMDNISEDALRVHGVSREMLSSGYEPPLIHEKLTKIFGKYINKFNKDDKFTAVGYNVEFDMKFLHSFFSNCGDKYCGSWVTWNYLCIFNMIKWFIANGSLALPNYKLATVCEHYGISLPNAHSAMDDIKATRELFYVVLAQLQPGYTFPTQRQN